MRTTTLIILLCLILSSLSCKKNISNSSKVQLITAKEMRDILELEDAQIIDVRTQKEYSQIYIENAQNIDYSSPTFDKDISKLDKKKSVILYCKGGTRSARCAEKLQEAGFEKIYDLEGGISKWKHSNHLKFKKKS
mgnify:CR=1 FL=1